MADIWGVWLQSVLKGSLLLRRTLHGLIVGFSETVIHCGTLASCDVTLPEYIRQGSRGLYLSNFLRLGYNQGFCICVLPFARNALPSTCTHRLPSRHEHRLLGKTSKTSPSCQLITISFVMSLWWHWHLCKIIFHVVWSLFVLWNHSLDCEHLESWFLV